MRSDARFGVCVRTVGLVGDVMPSCVRAYRQTNTPERQTLLGERAVAITMLKEPTNENLGTEPSVFPTQCKMLEMIPSPDPIAFKFVDVLLRTYLVHDVTVGYTSWSCSYVGLCGRYRLRVHSDT